MTKGQDFFRIPKHPNIRDCMNAIDIGLYPYGIGFIPRMDLNTMRSRVRTPSGPFGKLVRCLKKYGPGQIQDI
jgi:hypothetical protein